MRSIALSHTDTTDAIIIMANSAEAEGEWKPIKLFNILGLKLPAHLATDPQLLCDFITNFETRPDDIFVVGFPKSGTTWLQEIVWQIMHDGEVLTNISFARVPFFEIGTKAPVQLQPDINTMPDPRIFKTHLTYEVIPKGRTEDTRCKYVYIARNPKDCAVSYFPFTSDCASINGYNGPWEFFVKLFLEGNGSSYLSPSTVGWNHWSDHVLGWWKHKDDASVLFLKYEDLQKDLFSHVRIIANFLNKPLSEDVIRRIAEQCSFSGMMKNISSFTLQTNRYKVSFLRKGVVGDWKNYFTPELNERFEKEVLAKLEGSGLEFE